MGTHRHQQATAKLLETGRIGTLELRNRIIMSPMGTNLGHDDGRVSEQMLDYYEARAKGGAALVIAGVAAIAYPDGQAIPGQIGVSDDRFLVGLSDLAERIHRHGARAALQLQHAGKVATRDIAAGRPLWVPSPSDKDAAEMTGAGLMQDLTADEINRLVANLTGEHARLAFHEMTREDIASLVARFADAAARARRAGFDGVELHAGHGYIIAAFLSPATNHRNDEYGGTIEGRTRLLVEVVEAVKRAAGRDFPVWCRLDAYEYRIPGGTTLEQACRTARIAEEAGCDAVHVSAYGNPYSGIAFTEAPLVHRPGGFLEFARRIKQAVTVPVIAVGRISPERAERALSFGEADFIAMGRPLLADPELPRKLAEGHRATVRPCVYCYTCVGNIFVNESIVCAVNPRTAREAELAIKPTADPKKVLVVGAGPAGMEAARVAAERGHRVVLCERERSLGGTLRLAALVWEPHADLLDYFAGELARLRIEVRLSQPITAGLVAAIAPDVVLVASGARHEPPPIAGAERANVFSSEQFHELMCGRPPAGKLAGWQRTAILLADRLRLLSRPRTLARLTRSWMPLGRRVAIVGGGLVGIELAEFLSARGRRVTVIEQGPDLAPEMAIPRRWRALYELREAGAELIVEARVERIDAAGVHYAPAGGSAVGDGSLVPVAADHVVLATGASPDKSVATELTRHHGDVRTIGDCERVGMLAGAIESGARAACAL